ncbi:MAG: dienelactone hydrolase family protein [Pantoea sp.]|nr:dienelactone hydrolase family protein [Pantoea sp.]
MIMSSEPVTITTPDGECVSHVFTPANKASGPAIVFYMDAGGIRPAMFAMAQRLADAGYVVLLPDLYYRYGSYGPLDPGEVFKGDVHAILGPLMSTTGNAKAISDTNALLAWLETRNDVQGSKVGCVGFCMGGGMAIAAGASRPDRFAAVASFHGGNLATDAVDSPHNYLNSLKAKLYLGVAKNDPFYPPAMARQFEQALGSVGACYQSDIYSAEHGWMVPDFPVYNESEANRGWQRMLDFFKGALTA